jgi:hypothetical protein
MGDTDEAAIKIGGNKLAQFTRFVLAGGNALRVRGLPLYEEFVYLSLAIEIEPEKAFRALPMQSAQKPAASVCFAAALLVQLCAPVQDYRHGRHTCFQLRVDEEFLTIFTDIIGELFGGCDQFARIGLKERSRGACVKVSSRLHRNSHHSAVRGKVKQLFTVTSPSGLIPSRIRDLPFAMGLGKRGYINLPSAALVGGVCDPLAIR